MDETRRPPHPIVFLVLVVPFGASFGFVSVALAFLATRSGLTVQQGAELIATGMLPNVWKFFWAPIADTTLSRKRWYLLSAVLCAAGILNFYNADENWLTRLFALDYALWFDVLMPGLEKLRLPMPLGGTSNHFRTSALRDAIGLGPFQRHRNADLGIRLAQMGMRVAMLDSTDV